MTDNKLGRWRAIWIAFIVFLLAGEWLWYFWPAALVIWFGGWEALALLRKKKGDTFSEFCVGFLFEFGRDADGKVVRGADNKPVSRHLLPARAPLVFGVVCYIGLAIVTTFSHLRGLPDGLWEERMIAFVGGLVLWLLLHLGFALEKG